MKINHHLTRDHTPGPMRVLRAASVVPQSLDESTRSVSATCSTAHPVRIYDWGTDTVVDEVLISGGMRSDSATVPLILAHNHYDPLAVIGSVEQLTRGDSVVGRLIFSTAADVEPIYTRVREGHLKRVSIGANYTRNDYVEILPGKSKSIGGVTYTATDVSMRLVKRWTLDEVSIVTFGADPDAMMRRRIRKANRNREILYPKL